jgi:hypothetical protein
MLLIQISFDLNFNVGSPSNAARATVEPRRVCRRPFSLKEWTYDREETKTKLLA